MSSRCTVLIAAQALLPALTERMSAGGDETLAFADADTLRALQAIVTRRPDVVAIERDFAASSRGAALINRIAADPALTGSQVRIVAQGPAEASPAAAGSHTPEPAPDAPVDRQGTRRAPRFTLRGQIDATIDGNGGSLVDLATLGAQVVSPTVLRPNQRVRLVLSDGTTTVRATGTIVWATFEIPPGSGPRYRAGIEFVNPDTAAIDRFRRTHQT